MRDGGACNGDTHRRGTLSARCKASSPRRRTVLLRLRRAPRPARSRHKRPERRALPRRKFRQHMQPPPLRRCQSPPPPPPARPPPHDGSPPFHTPELPIGAPPAKHSQGAARTGPSPQAPSRVVFGDYKDYTVDWYFTYYGQPAEPISRWEVSAAASSAQHPQGAASAG
jgi:hypothetical protein